MSEYRIRNPNGFNKGYTAITQIGEKHHDTGIEFGILKLAKGDIYPIDDNLESAYLLMTGECEFAYDHATMSVKRSCYFDDAPYALHLATGQSASITALADCEFAVSRTENPVFFPAQIFTPENMLEHEDRGKGLLENTAWRMVRTIFDIRNRPQARLVLGEVITLPGRWSSYPPHHHAQPEIYHYRFTEAQGYGHSECGDEIFKVQEFDTYKILDANDHAQVAAPGYGMYYIWVIRHLDNNPYDKPEFTPEHHWTTSPEANQKVWPGFNNHE